MYNAGMNASPQANADARVTAREIQIAAEDGFLLAATLFEPATPPPPGAPLVVVAPGAAILQRFYARFATAIARRGHPVVTFDFRDIGGSRHGSLKTSKVRMRDWCLTDVPTMLSWAERTHPGRPIHWVGHSMGGFATGLAHNNHLIVRQLNVATLSGYWGRVASPEKYRIYLLMGYASPPIVAALGYFPGRLMGGEDMPGPAYLEWMRWCMQPDFLFGDATLPGRENFAKLAAPIRFLQIADDPWGTPAAVAHIADHFTGSVDRSVRRITPQEAGVTKIGHFGFYRSEAGAQLWQPAIDWLLDEASTRAGGIELGSKQAR